ncbi:MAG: bis(5'-nucleosyl)-tetraphosphatase (symmetrical) YqeK [Leptolyngbya sp. BL-A-14]
MTDAKHLQTAKQPVDLTIAKDAPIHSAGSALNPDSPLLNTLMPVELRDRVIRWLQKHVPVSRLEHILRVEQMAVDLAMQHRLDPARAAQAGLMHDLAKFFKPQRLLQMAQTEGLTLDPVDVANPHLLHAAVGAIVARDEFGIQDEGVLDAIRHHTLGCPGMSELSCVVFLADSLEPGRGNTQTLTSLRQNSQKNLYRAVWLTCDESLRYLLSRAQQIHPRMVLTRNWALEVATKKLPLSRVP